MTNEQAIKILVANKNFYERIVRPYDREMVEALNLAIKALENDRPTGEWKESKEHFYTNDGCKEWTNFYCSVCDTPSNEPYNFCPNCGAKMKEAENETNN